MKNSLSVGVALITLLAIMAFTPKEKSFPFIESINIFDTYPVVMIPVEIEAETMPISSKDHDDFLDAIGHKESGNNYEVTNKFGYMGKYQFGLRTLRGLGYKVSREEFVSSPDMQEDAMQELLLHNREKLRKLIEKYEGEVVNGVFITESGVLAAAHLAGAGNVKKFFTKGADFEDGFGTKLTTYLKQFSGYELDLE